MYKRSQTLTNPNGRYQKSSQTKTFQMVSSCWASSHLSFHHQLPGETQPQTTDRLDHVLWDLRLSQVELLHTQLPSTELGEDLSLFGLQRHGDLPWGNLRKNGTLPETNISSTWKIGLNAPKGKDPIPTPSIFRCELLVSGRISKSCLKEWPCAFSIGIVSFSWQGGVSPSKQRETHMKHRSRSRLRWSEFSN